MLSVFLCMEGNAVQPYRVGYVEDPLICVDLSSFPEAPIYTTTCYDVYT